MDIPPIQSPQINTMVESGTREDERPSKRRRLSWEGSNALEVQDSGLSTLNSHSINSSSRPMSLQSSPSTNMEHDFSSQPNTSSCTDTPAQSSDMLGTDINALECIDDLSHVQGQSAISPDNNSSLNAPDQDVICLGILSHVRAQLEINPNDIKVNGDLTDDSFAFELVQQQKYFYLRNDGQSIAALNRQLCAGLCELEDFAVEYSALVHRSAWVDKITSWKKHSRSASVVEVDIVLYCPKCYAEQVGEALSKSKLYLQFPSKAQVVAGFESFNPHWLHLNTSNDENTQDVMDWTEDDSLGKQEPSNAKEHLLDETPQVALLKESTIDSRIKTSLYPYQRLAVDFILRKEGASLPPSLNLWQSESNKSGIRYFSHALVGKREANAPLECEGGILADDMGLGKSLTMLAVIVATLNQSKDFMQSPDTSDSRRCSATLIVAPSVLILDGWAHEIRDHVQSDVLRVHKYHGYEKEIDFDGLQRKDIVLTTFATIESDARARGHRFFPRYHWFRIVLDEAHVIRTRTTQQFNAVRAIPAAFRWCLTGTPMQNKLEDFGALVNFIRVPFMEDRTTFRKCIIRPHDQKPPDLSGLRTLLGALCLRRSRSVLSLPDPCITEKRLKMSPEETQRYNETYSICQQRIQYAHDHSSNSAIRKAYLRLYLRLRMACNNGTFERRPPSWEEDPLTMDTPNDEVNDLQPDECPTCFIDVSASEVRLCGKCTHKVCRQCMPEVLLRAQSASFGARKTCNVCQKSFLPRNYSASEARFDLLTDAEVNAGISTKMQAVLEDIKEHKTHCNSLIFSSWKTTLDLLARILVHNHIPHKFIHGQISISERRSILESFQRDRKGNVLLMTLGTGAVGLNLFTASRIHVVEPQWNPAVESQAIGRAVRLGQTREVTVIRYLMEETVEVVNVQTNQWEKLRLAEGFSMGC